jgi:hypothetical protein
VTRHDDRIEHHAHLDPLRLIEVRNKIKGKLLKKKKKKTDEFMGKSMVGDDSFDAFGW